MGRIRPIVVQDGFVRLKLVIQGRVVHNHGKRIAVSIKHHDFYLARSFSKGMIVQQENVELVQRSRRI